MSKRRYDVTGMTCAACSTRVEKAVGKLEGIEKVTVNLLTNSMQVEYKENTIGSEQIVQAVVKAGYGASLHEDTEAGTTHRIGAAEQGGKSGGRVDLVKKEQDDMRKRLIVSIIFWIPLMFVAMYHMLLDLLNIPMSKWLMDNLYGNENIITFAFTQVLLLIPILYVNRKYFIHGFKNLFSLAPNMDTLIAIGSTAAVLYGIFAIYAIGYGLGHGNEELVMRYGMDLYFESAGTILTLITLGKYLESYSKGKTSAAIEKLMDLSPKTALVERDGKEYTIPVGEVQVGEIVVVKPGAYVPVDGTVLEGQSSVEEAAITGESIPVVKGVGDKVISATMNQNGFFKMKAEKVGQDTTIQQIIRLVEEASSSKAPIAKLADQISGVFVPIVIAIAVIAFIVWMLAGATFEFAISTVIAILVISCPCALGLATPVAIMVGTGKGAENGILIKSGEALELLHKTDTVVLDKTGTITEGKPKLTDIYLVENYANTEDSEVGQIQWSKDTLLSIAAGLEKQSEHPLAEAILQYAEENHVDIYQMESFQAVQGKGILGVYQGKHYLAGNEKLLAEHGVDIDGIKKISDQYSDEGKTPLLFAEEGKVIGVIAVADKEKASSREAIRQLEKMNINVIMLTGDNERVAGAMQKKMGISQVIAGVLPQEKEKHVRMLKEQGHIVCMVGDGVNDAPALARADVGLAIGAGTEVAIESADAVLIKNDLLDVVTAIKLSKAVIKNIKQNLFWAFFYNVIGIPIAAGILYPAFAIKLNPMLGAAAMSLSSVFVVTNALRLRLLFTGKNKKTSLNKKQTNSKKEIETKTEKEIETKTETKTEINAKIQSTKKEEKNMYQYELTVEGMMCDHCKKHVTEALGKLASEVEVSVPEKKAYVKNETEITKDSFEKCIVDAGYELIDVK